MKEKNNEKVQVDVQEEVVHEELKAIEVLKNELKTSSPIFEAVKLSNRWAEGKEVTRLEFEAAISKWLGSSIDKGRRVK